jgi:type III pantothenate kinase
LADLPSLPQLDDLPLIAVDVGNNRTKFGLFQPELLSRLAPRALPEPQRTFHVAGPDADWKSICAWLDEKDEAKDGQECLSSCGVEHVRWSIGSVNRPGATRLIGWLRTHRPQDPVTLLAAGDLPLEVSLERPDMVGIDRLLDALAANRLRRPGRPAVVVDVGTAITVDLLSPDGAFLGGSILPGITMGARALHEFTDMLPLLDVADLSGPPPALGTATIEAMQSGLFWGAIGAIRQLIAELAKGLSPNATQPEVFLTGGAGPAVAGLLGRRARHVPHLTLSGIALASLEP